MRRGKEMTSLEEEHFITFSYGRYDMLTQVRIYAGAADIFCPF